MPSSKRVSNIRKIKQKTKTKTTLSGTNAMMTTTMNNNVGALNFVSNTQYIVVGDSKGLILKKNLILIIIITKKFLK
jgi:hypothetical protein